MLNDVLNVAGVVVGTLPNLQHGLGGTFEILSPTRINLRDFSYDGLGPGKTDVGPQKVQ